MPNAQGPDREPVVMDGKAAAEKFGVQEEQVHTCEGVNKILVWDGDLSWKGKMDMDGDGKTAGTIVSGDLTVDGDVANWEMDYGNFLWVGGNVVCRHMVSGGGEIYVRGDVTAAGIVLAHYNHGRLTVGGKVTAQRLIQEGDHEVTVGSLDKTPASDGNSIQDGGGTIIGSCDFSDVLIDDVLEGKDEDADEDEPRDIDWPELQGRMEAGVPVLRQD